MSKYRIRLIVSAFPRYEFNGSNYRWIYRSWTCRDASGSGSFRTPSRLVNMQAGRALEILGHAIEYLTDEYVREAKHLSAHDPQVEAIQLLMTINREVYFGCPIVPTFADRMRAWIGFRQTGSRRSVPVP